MTSPVVTCVVAVLLLTCSCCGHGARILGIFPTPAMSHQLPFQVIMKALAARGHQVTVISPNPLKTPVANYTDVDLSFCYDLVNSSVDYNTMHLIEPLSSMRFYHEAYLKIIDLQLSSPQMQAFMKSKPKFDLVFIEKLFFPAYNGLAHFVGSPPVISIISFGGKTTAYTAIGNPHHPAVIPDVMTSYSDHMTFWERLYNIYVYVMYHYLWYQEFIPKQEVLVRKHFGSGPPPLYEADYNDSLLLVNNHWSLSYVKPLLPNVVEVTGLHVKTKADPLPKDIKNFLDGAEHGVVYFSLGSLVRSEKLPKEKLNHIVQAFSEIPQRVLWKWEADVLPGLSSNVMQAKWMPQQDILPHPNIRVFITQGGLQSFQEAAYHGVPLIGMPFLGDQKYNVGKFVSAKIGVGLPLNDLTKETLLEALGKVINDSSYRENMKTFSAVYREEVGPSLDRAIWWIEYVIRHNGARHLRSAALDLAWYQYLLLDVIAVLGLALVAALSVTYVVLKKTITLSKRYFFTSKLKKS
ncbi:UDP-glycosyltransferase UGT5 isoform X1 [Anabrus simplex]|uniref:UDP-glycosyltransferase UGT5 isoform X1 n=1 Tax=Anabrus simplex TaxID=316456 RepID=UPI0035A2BA16